MIKLYVVNTDEWSDTLKCPSAVILNISILGTARLRWNELTKTDCCIFIITIVILWTPVIALHHLSPSMSCSWAWEECSIIQEKWAIISLFNTIENPALQFTYSLCPPTRDKASNLLTGPLSGCRSGSRFLLR